MGAVFGVLFLALFTLLGMPGPEDGGVGRDVGELRPTPRILSAEDSSMVVSRDGQGVWAEQLLRERSETRPVEAHWFELARCESGDWHDEGGSFSGPIRWDWGADVGDLPQWAALIDRGGGYVAQFHGGLQFHPDTWEWVAGDLGVVDRFPAAFDAPPWLQVKVAAELQSRQGWGAWPVCSELVGLG